jgi:hypothetical protein
MIPYAAEPNRVVSTGTVSLDAVGLAFKAGQDRVVMEARTGQVDERTIELPYEEVQDVSVTNDVAPGIEITTPETEYEATDISPSVREVRRVATAIRRHCPNISTERTMMDGAEPNDRPSTTSDRSPSTSAVGNQKPTNATDDGIVTVDPGDVMTCPECGSKTAVPEQLPDQRQEANCPDCAATVGYVDETSDHIIIEGASAE